MRRSSRRSRVPGIEGSRSPGARSRIAADGDRRRPATPASNSPAVIVPAPSPDASRADQRISRSARAGTDEGTVIPSACAATRLMTSSTFVGSSTGTSDGFAPFAIFGAWSLPPWTPHYRRRRQSALVTQARLRPAEASAHLSGVANGLGTTTPAAGSRRIPWHLPSPPPVKPPSGPHT